MAQTEVFELVVTAVNRAGPALARVSGALDLVKQDTVALDTVMRQGADNLRRGGVAIRNTGESVQDFHTRMRDTVPNWRKTHVEASNFGTTIGGTVLRSITRLAGPIVAAAASINAFKNKLVESKNLANFSKSIGLSPNMIKGIRQTGEEFGIESGKIDEMLTGFTGHLQAMKFGDPGEFFTSLRQVPEAQGLAAEMSTIMRDATLSDEEKQKQVIMKWQAFLHQYREQRDEGTLRVLLGRMGLPEDWAAFGRMPADEYAARIRRLGEAAHSLNPEDVERFWKAIRELTLQLSNFTVAVLKDLLPLMTKFVELLSFDLKDFSERRFPQYTKMIEDAYRALKKFVETNPIDWGVEFIKAQFTDFINTALRFIQQVRAKLGLSTKSDVDAARRTELEFREQRGTISDDERNELKQLETADEYIPGTFAPYSDEDVSRAIKQFQKQKFVDTDDEGIIRAEEENTRALKFLTDEVKKLNMNFMRRPAPDGDGTEVVEGRQFGGPVHAGRSYLVGEGGASELFVPRQQGGPVQAVGTHGAQLFTPAQSGAVVPGSNDLSLSAFQTMFKGGVLAGKYDAVVAAASKHGIPPSLMASIIATETGYGKSRAVREFKNPAGIMAGGKGNKQFQKFETLEEGLERSAEVQKRIYERGGQTIAGMGGIYAPVGPGGKPVANDPHNTNRLWPGLVSGLQTKLQDRGYDPGGLQDTAVPTGQIAGISPVISPVQVRGPSFRVAEEESMTALQDMRAQLSNLPTPDQRTAAQAAEAAAPIVQASVEPPVQSPVEQPVQPPADLIPRQQGGPVEAVTPIDGRPSDLPDLPAPRAPFVGGGINLRSRFPRHVIRQLDEERFRQMQMGIIWEQMVKEAEQRRGTPEWQNAPGRSVWEGGTLPVPGDIDKTIREGGGGRLPDPLRGIDPENWQKEASLRNKILPGSLDAVQNDAPGYEATGSLNVNVRAPRGTSVKAEGTGPFETVNMTRRMTDQQQTNGTV